MRNAALLIKEVYVAASDYMDPIMLIMLNKFPNKSRVFEHSFQGILAIFIQERAWADVDILTMSTARQIPSFLSARIS
jgi:hypothetical protein